MINLNFDKKNINLYINYFLVGYAFCLPISKAGTNFFEISILLMWLYEGNWKYKLSQYKTNPLIVTFALFLIYSLISVFWASSISFGLDYISKYRHFLIIPVIYTSLDKKYINHIFSAFLISMFISEVVSYGIFFELWTYKNISPDDPSPFMSHTDYSIYLTFTAMILITRIFYEHDFKYKIIYSLFIVSVISNLLINGGRTGQVTFVIVLFIVFILNMKNKIKAFILSLLLLNIIFVSAYNFSPNFKHRLEFTVTDVSQMINNNDYTKPLAQRVSLWIVGVSKFKDNYLLGTGIGNEMKDIESYTKKLNITTIDLTIFDDHHNMFLTYSVQLGILGMLLILSIFYFLFKLKFKYIQYKNLNLVFIITYSLWSFGGLTFHLMNAMVFFAFFAGLFNKISLIEKESK